MYMYVYAHVCMCICMNTLDTRGLRYREQIYAWLEDFFHCMHGDNRY